MVLSWCPLTIFPSSYWRQKAPLLFLMWVSVWWPFFQFDCIFCQQDIYIPLYTLLCFLSHSSPPPLPLPPPLPHDCIHSLPPPHFISFMLGPLPPPSLLALSCPYTPLHPSFFSIFHLSPLSVFLSSSSTLPTSFLPPSHNSFHSRFRNALWAHFDIPNDVGVELPVELMWHVGTNIMEEVFAPMENRERHHASNHVHTHTVQGCPEIILFFLHLYTNPYCCLSTSCPSPTSLPTPPSPSSSLTQPPPQRISFHFLLNQLLPQ